MPVLFPESATLRTFTGWATDAENFVTGKAGAATAAIEGSFQPIAREQIPEDLTEENVEFVVYIDTALWPTPAPLDEENDIPADEIDYNGTTYRVLKTKVWPTGLANAECYITRDLSP